MHRDLGCACYAASIAAGALGSPQGFLAWLQQSGGRAEVDAPQSVLVAAHHYDLALPGHGDDHGEVGQDDPVEVVEDAAARQLHFFLADLKPGRSGQQHLPAKSLPRSQHIVPRLGAHLFQLAGEKHRNYYQKNREEQYCRVVIQPKLEKYRKAFTAGRSDPSRS